MMCGLPIRLAASASRLNRAIASCVVRVLVEHHLDRDALAELDVLGLVDDAHAAAPDLAHDRVALFERDTDQ